MAKITLSGDELVCLLTANGLVPEEVLDIELVEGEIKVHVRTPWPVLKSIRVGMRFIGFERGQAVLQLVTNRFVDRFAWLVDKMLAAFPLAEHGACWKYPRLFLDVNRLLQEQVRGTQITDIVFEDGLFHVTTVHALDSSSSPGEENAGRSDPPAPSSGSA